MRILYKEERLPGGTVVCVNENHRFGTDAMLLAHFCNIRRNETGCDLGTGCGIIPLKWHDAGHKGYALGIEIAQEGVALFQQALQKNALTHIDALQADLCTVQTNKFFDVVCCNPPYFTGGYISPNKEKAAARHELFCTMEDIAQVAKKLLKDGGRFCVCQRPERLVDVFCAMRQADIEPKHIRFVKQRKNEDKAWLVLVDGRKNGKPGLHFQKDLIVETTQGTFSAEMLAIYGKEVAQ